MSKKKKVLKEGGKGLGDTAKLVADDGIGGEGGFDVLVDGQPGMHVEGSYVYHDLSHCAICKGREDEDMILLCDGCDLEIHMYCLRPIITVVPEGSWYCPGCDPQGTAATLESYLRSHATSRNEFMQSNNLHYNEWLAVQQHNLLPMPLWSPYLLPAFSASQLRLVPSQFDSASEVHSSIIFF